MYEFKTLFGPQVNSGNLQIMDTFRISHFCHFVL